MNTYLIIGLVIVAIFFVYIFFFRSSATDEVPEILSYDVKDEEKIANNLPNMDLEKMAQYADKVTKANANNKKFLKMQLPEDLLEKLKAIELNDDNKHMLLNPTTFGNSAFIVLNSTEPYKTRAKEAVDYLRSLLS